jgi:hypothetical protein
MLRLIQRNQQQAEKVEKEFHQLIDALSLSVAELERRVADLTDVGDDVPEPHQVRQARIPAKPAIMVNAGAGKGG